MVECPHPGIVLTKMLKDLDISARALARELNIPSNRVSDIMRGRRSITASTAIKFGNYFKQDSYFWLDLQNKYDLAIAQLEYDSNVGNQ